MCHCVCHGRIDDGCICLGNVGQFRVVGSMDRKGMVFVAVCIGVS